MVGSGVTSVLLWKEGPLRSAFWGQGESSAQDIGHGNVSASARSPTQVCGNPSLDEARLLFRCPTPEMVKWGQGAHQKLVMSVGGGAGRGPTHLQSLVHDWRDRVQLTHGEGLGCVSARDQQFVEPHAGFPCGKGKGGGAEGDSGMGQTPQAGPWAPCEKVCDPDWVTTSLRLSGKSDLFDQPAHLCDFSDPKIQNVILCGDGTPPKTETPPPTQSLFLSLGPWHLKREQVFPLNSPSLWQVERPSDTEVTVQFAANYLGPGDQKSL